MDKETVIKTLFIESLKKSNVNFDYKGSNYIDDTFDSVFDAVLLTIDELK